MYKSMKFKLIAVVVSVFMVATANAASKNSAKVLQYVPADSPYVIAATEPVPTKVADKFEGEMNEILVAYRDVLQAVIDSGVIEDEESDDGKSEQTREVMKEMMNLMSIEGLRSAGIGRDAAFVLYGNGLTPVIRFELTDTKLFDSTIARIEEKAGTALSVAEVKGESYRFADIEMMKIIVATLDEQAVITVVPASFDESQISTALGIKKPKSNMRSAKKLQAIQKEYGYEGFFTGFVDFERIAATMTGDISGQDAEVLQAFGHELPEMSDVCSAEIMSMARIAPRMVMGYNKLTVDVAESSFIIEMRDDIAAGLSKITAAVPGLGIDQGALVSFGMSMNPLSAKNFLAARLDAMEADPYECEMLADLQSGVGDMRAALEQPLPPVVYGFRGFVTDIMAVNGMDLAAGTPPETVDGGVLVAIEGAQGLVAMGAMMDPELASLNLQPDGKPVKLTMASIAEFAEEAYAALSDSALSLAFGEGSESKSADMLVADSATVAPFMSISMDADEYYSFMAEAMDAEAAAETDEEGESEEMPPAVKEAMRKAMLAGGDFYDRIAADVLFTERGIEINSRATFVD